MFASLPHGSILSNRPLGVRVSPILTARTGIRRSFSRSSTSIRKVLDARSRLGRSRGLSITQSSPPSAPKADHEGVQHCPPTSASNTQLQALKGNKPGFNKDSPLPITSDADVEASYSGLDDSLGLEAGVIPESRLQAEDPTSSSAQPSTSGRRAYATAAGSLLYPPAQRSHIRESW